MESLRKWENLDFSKLKISEIRLVKEQLHKLRKLNIGEIEVAKYELNSNLSMNET